MSKTLLLVEDEKSVRQAARRFFALARQAGAKSGVLVGSYFASFARNRPEFGLANRDDFARVNPGATALGGLLRKICGQQARRPHFAVTCDNVAIALWRGLDQGDRLQHILDVFGVGTPLVQHVNERITLEQGCRRARVALPYRVEFFGEAVIVTLGQRRKPQQCIRHSTHSGNDDTDTVVGPLQQYVRNPAEAFRVPQATATKLMNYPTTRQRTIPSAKP